jgi:hypothetical protein
VLHDLLGCIAHGSDQFRLQPRASEVLRVFLDCVPPEL